MKKLMMLFMFTLLMVGMSINSVYATSNNPEPYVYTGVARYVTESSASISGTAYVVPESSGIEWGVAYSTRSEDSSPTFRIASSEDFTIELTGLRSGRVYYYRTFIRYYDRNRRQQIEYGTEKNFTTDDERTSSSPTPSPGESVVNIPRVSVNSNSEATLESSFVANGNTVRYAGFVYSSTKETPTRSNATDIYDQVDSSDTSFSKKLSNLERNTTYYVRAYITVGTSRDYTDVYSSTATFTTSQSGEPRVYTDSVNSVNATGADIKIEVVAGGPTIVERGVVYSNKQTTPELYSSKSQYKSVSGNTGTATVVLTELDSGETYYVRAYARNADGVYYGETKKFVTGNDVDITTLKVSDITSSTAIANGNISGVSSFVLEEKGFVFSEDNKNPTVKDRKVYTTSSLKSGAYAMELTGLNVSTTYYVRAYAYTDDSISYGETVSFTTNGIKVPVAISYRTTGATEVGSEVIRVDEGTTLTASDLTIPQGYKLYERDWSRKVQDSSSITVLVEKDATKTTEGVFMEGVGSFMFAPDRATTRAEVAQIIYNLATSRDAVTAGMVFTDVPVNHSAKVAIDYVSSKGYMRGYPDGSFKPNNTITRAEICVVLSMVYGLQSNSSQAATNAFSDVKPNDWFYSYVAMAYNNAMLYGYPDGSFKPANTTTRAEICTIFSNSEKRTLVPLGTVQFTDVPSQHWAYKYIMNASMPRP